MIGRRILIFSSKADIGPIIESIEKIFKIYYCKTGLFDSKNVPIYQSISSIPDFGFTTDGDWNGIDSFLILQQTNSLNIRDVPQRKGGIKYVVDQVINQQSITIKAGGIYLVKTNVLIAGQITTVSEDIFANEIFLAFSKLIKKEFKKINDFYVGRDAEYKLESGWRLVLDERRSKENDLKK